MSLTSEPESQIRTQEPESSLLETTIDTGTQPSTDIPHAPYREPEVVIEPIEEHPPGYVPGVVAEHLVSDDDNDSDIMPLDSSPTSSTLR